ncbi:MND1-interacting protein 1 [Magnolia sinica]|uniref:MND1-interacting protein 1 n=1 Tax=Magnolia sinica TaxID=86752 RepID=UPI0026591EA5|nr:MND1-interacting protein 1 [Magnolia sinica]
MGREKIIRTNRKPRANPIKPDPTDPSDKTHIPDASTNLSTPTIDDISGVPNPNPNFNKACWGHSTEEELQELLLKNLEFIYTEAISKLVLFGIEEGLALKSILRNGHCYGTMDVLPNILHNALAYLNSIGSDCNWDSDRPEYGFASLRQLAEYSLDSMVRHLQKVRPQLTEGDAMWCLFKNNFHVGHASSMEMPALAPPGATNGETADSSASPGLSGFHGSWGFGGVEFPVNASMYVSKMREIEYVPKGFQLSSLMKALLNQNVPAFAAVIRANSQAVLQSQARQRPCSNSLPSNDLRVQVESGSGISSVQYEEPRDCQNSDMMSSVLDSLGNMSIDVKPDEAANQKSKMISNLENQMRELEGQLKERREWALKKAIQAARRLSNDSTELKMLKMEREETHRHKGKQTLGDSTMKRLSEMENALRTASGQVDRANAAVRRLDTENAEIKAEMEAAKLSAAESAAACSEAEKREKKYLKRLQVWENQEAKLQEEITEEKQKIAQLQRQLELVKEAQKETEIKWRQEQKAKVQAIAKVEEERRAKEAAEATVKRRQETLHREIERDFQRHKDDIQRLEQELSRLKASADSSQVDFPSNTSGKGDSEAPRVMNSKMFHDSNKLQESSQKEVNHGRECLLCKKDEVSIVFLPCAHQVLCSGCNEEHKKAAKTSCPCCGIQIEQRIHVYGASS